jgi:hypothetical protein
MNLNNMQNEKHIPKSNLASDEDKPNGKESPTKQSYGNEFNAHFLEQYKLYVEMADRVSSRRVQIASLYTSILSALLALLSITSNKELFQGSQSVVLLTMSVLGLCLCLAWYININSYKQLNRLKFKVIHKMESHLPFPCYRMEWEILSNDTDLQKYFRLTAIEKYIPVILTTPYLCLFVYSLIKIFGK